MHDVQGRLIDLYNEERECLGSLHELLVHEVAHIRRRNTSEIDNCAKSKGQILEKLDNLDKERQVFLESLESGTGTQQTNIQESRKIVSLKASIQSLLDECRHQNHINGSVIEISQLFNRQILDIIRGVPGDQTTYNATGKNQKLSPIQTIARI